MQRLFTCLVAALLVVGLASPVGASPSPSSSRQGEPAGTADGQVPRTHSEAAKRSVTLKVTERSITLGENVRVSGKVKAGLGTVAVVQRKVRGKWTTQARAGIVGGRYSAVIVPIEAKKHRLRVRVEKSGRLVAAKSKPITIRVTRPKKRDLVLSELRNARVPSLCGHPAGRLRNGSLPGIAAGQGEVTFVRAVFGELDGKRGRDAAAVIRCNLGGVGWPDHVLLYTANKAGKPTYRGDFDTSSVVRFGRESVRSVRLVARRVHVDAYAGEKWECMACGSVEVRATLKVSKGRAKVVSTSRYGAEEALRTFLAAANRGDVAAAKRMSIPTDGIHPAETAIAAVRDGGALSPLPTYAGVGITACEQLPQGGPAFTCEVRNSKDEITVMVSRRGWGQWEVFEFFWYGY